tara:strand:- start:12041 stop:12964 length:924 start_codon:yes stop_codon:yes gene_type:complete
MAFFVPVVYALGGMLIRVAAKKVAERLAKEGAKKLTKKAAEELIEQGTKVTKATTKNVDQVISQARNVSEGVKGIRASGRPSGGSRSLGEKPQLPTTQVRPSDLKPSPSLGRGVRSGADDFKFAEIIPPKTSKTPKLQGPRIRKDADDAILGDLTTIPSPNLIVPSFTRIVSDLRRALEDGERRVEIEPLLNEMEKTIQAPKIEIGSSAGADEMPPNLDTTPDASLQRDDETFDAMGEETEVMKPEPTFDSFGKAFSYYRRQKRVPTFMYKGNLYTTRFKEETVPQHKKLFNVAGSYAEDYQSRQGV